jgi:cellulose synthase operon protein YhjQ
MHCGTCLEQAKQEKRKLADRQKCGMLTMADPNTLGDQEDGSTQDDVATLYSWANLHGAKYRDFSASRAQAREEARLRVEAALAAEKRRQEEEAERQAQELAQIAAREAAEAAEAARQAEAERLAEEARQAEAERQAVLAAQEAQRQAALQRAWKPAPPTEMGNSHDLSSFASPESRTTGQVVGTPAVPVEHGQGSPYDRTPLPGAGYSPSSQWPGTYTPQDSEFRHQPQSEISHPLSGSFPLPTRDPESSAYASSGLPQTDSSIGSEWPSPDMPGQRDSRDRKDLPESGETHARPAWLAADFLRSQAAHPVSQAPAHFSAVSVSSASNSPHPTSQSIGQIPGANFGSNHVAGSKGHAPQSDNAFPAVGDRAAHRWFALKSIFDPTLAPVEQQAHAPARVPVLAVFSLAGGVGKTSIVAALGRALSSRSERVLLVDTAVYGLLPFFFGAHDQRPGALRTFNPPGVSAEAPIQLVTLDPESHPPEITASHASDPTQDWLVQEVGRYSRESSRILIDLPTASGATTRRVLNLVPDVLVPVIPDMNSVVSVGAIESFFRNSTTPSGKPIMPYYVLNQFDYSLPLHLDVREILREQIGDRLLPFALRRSPAVSEALAEGMTVMDYAPTATVAEDYASLAGWVRGLSAPANVGPGGVRWSER